jgi:hypothetical protein
VFDEIFKTKVNELWNLFSATGGLNHRGEKGSFREEFVKQLLVSVLPGHYGVGSGVVVDKWGKQSPQVDLVIYDKRRMPPLLERDGHGIYPIDSVLRVLEVKSYVDVAAIDQYFSQAWAFHPGNNEGLKMASAGSLPNGHSNYPLCGLFGFSTGIVDFKAAVSSRKNKCSSGILYCDGKGVVILGKENDSLITLSDRVEDIKYWVAVFVGAIEDTANSRSEFKPLDWFSFKKKD